MSFRELFPKKRSLLTDYCSKKIVSFDAPRDRHTESLAAIGRLRLAGAIVPDPSWFLYGFVRKEAVLSSQVEGTQATLRDIATSE